MTCSHSIQPRCVQLSMPGARSRCDPTRGRIPHPTRAIFLLGPSKSSCNSAPDIGRCPRTEVGERREPVSRCSMRRLGTCILRAFLMMYWARYLQGFIGDYREFHVVG